MREDCTTGEPAPPRQDLLDILSRAYPRSAPGVLTSLSAEGADVALAGSAPERSCGLELWIPGGAEPELETTGITNLEATAVPGGWIVTGCADGDYTVATRE